MRQLADADQRKQVEWVFDAIRNAQVTSVPKVAAIEAQILSKTGEIRGVANDPGKLNSVIDDTLALIRQRDALIRISR